MQELSNARILSVGQDGQKHTKKLERTGNIKYKWKMFCKKVTQKRYSIFGIIFTYWIYQFPVLFSNWLFNVPKCFIGFYWPKVAAISAFLTTSQFSLQWNLEFSNQALKKRLNFSWLSNIKEISKIEAGEIAIPNQTSVPAYHAYHDTCTNNQIFGYTMIDVSARIAFSICGLVWYLKKITKQDFSSAFLHRRSCLLLQIS